MLTHCNGQKTFLQPLDRRDVVFDYSAGRLSSDAGLILLREAESAFGIIERIASCFEDHRDKSRIEHTLYELLKQRIMALAAGYEDLNDHDELAADPLLAAVVGKTDPTGEERKRARDRGRPLASASTLGRLEQVADVPEAHRYNRFSCAELSPFPLPELVDVSVFPLAELTAFLIPGL